MVALKLLPTSLGNRPAVERFEREVQAIGRLNHPSIVTATDADTNGPNPYLVMEYIDGVDLASLLRAHGRLPVREAAKSSVKSPSPFSMPIKSRWSIATLSRPISCSIATAR